MNSTAHIAIDMGAESGRVIVGRLTQGRLTTHEVHRFTHTAINMPTGLHWDTTGILREITAGLRKATAYCNEQSITPDTIGADTWGVDHALVNQAREILGLPHCYRDPRTTAHFEAMTQRLGQEVIYRMTGIQFMPLNSLYQVIATQANAPDLLANAHRLLFMPDLIHFFLSGSLANERTIASTSQMLEPDAPEWSTELLNKVGLPMHFLHDVVEPGTQIGTIRPELSRQTGLPPTVRVVVPGSHDTASAVAAVPAEVTPEGERPDWCFLSSGTWSLLGVERQKPDTSVAALEAGFTNEYAVGGKIRFLKNISGLWLVQEIRRDLAKQGKAHDYAALTEMAENAAPFHSVIDGDAAEFAQPGDMIRKIQAAAEAAAQPVPESPGELVRTALLSLANTYRETIDQLRSLGNTITKIHLVGGGSQNQLLNQMTADATGLPVIVGPVEATAIGNLLTQALGGTGESLEQIREVVRASSDLQTVMPASAQTAA